MAVYLVYGPYCTLKKYFLRDWWEKKKLIRLPNKRVLNFIFCYAYYIREFGD
jgi:hypothetical protein